jgi:hypothetical protein
MEATIPEAADRGSLSHLASRPPRIAGQRCHRDSSFERRLHQSGYVVYEFAILCRNVLHGSWRQPAVDPADDTTRTGNCVYILHTHGHLILLQINHLYFHRFEPKSATLPLLLLAVQPLALLVILGVPISYTSVPVAYLTFIASLCSSIVIYRISPWHPLAEFPGPMVNKISKIWGAWISVDGGQHRVNKRLHDIYGPFVRTGKSAFVQLYSYLTCYNCQGPNEISVIHVDAIKSVLGSGGFPKGQCKSSQNL